MNPPSTGSGLMNPLQAQTLAQLLQEILGFVIQIGSVVVVLMLVFVGFKFVMAQGKSEDIASARTALMWTVIGALVLLGATAISTAISTTASQL